MRATGGESLLLAPRGRDPEHSSEDTCGGDQDVHEGRDDVQGAHGVYQSIVEKHVRAGQLQQRAEVTEKVGDPIVGAE